MDLNEQRSLGKSFMFTDIEGEYTNNTGDYIIFEDPSSSVPLMVPAGSVIEKLKVGNSGGYEIRVDGKVVVHSVVVTAAQHIPEIWANVPTKWFTGANENAPQVLTWDIPPPKWIVVRKPRMVLGS